MIFSIDTINQSFNKPLKTPVVEESGYDVSLFTITLESVMQEQREFESSMILLNEGIVSNIAKDYASKKIDKVKSLSIKDILDKIFDWFCNAITKLHEAFIICMTKLLRKEVRIKAFKSKLGSFQGEVRYNRKYYDYTNILADSSYANYQAEISKEYDDLINKLSDLGAANTPMEVADILTNIKTDIDYTVEDLDVLRGKLLGSNSTISGADFAKALFKYFRNDRSEPHNPGLGFSKKNLTTTDVQQAYEGYFGYSKQEQIVKRESSKLKSQALAQKIKVRTINIKDYVSKDTKLDFDISKTYSTIINIKCRKIKDICDIYVLFYSAKLDALKEYNIKNRDILLAAIDEIVKQEVNNNDK